MQNKLLTILFLGLSVFSFGQNKITGYAPDYVGEKVTLYTYQDYVTMSKIEIGHGIVSEKDSSFSIIANTNTTIKAIIEIGKAEASLYLAPNSNYDVFFPKVKTVTEYQNTSLNMYFNSIDTSDINYRILQYHEWFDMFLSYNNENLSRGNFSAYLDTFRTYASAAYEHINDVYFITYVRYDIAEMEQVFGGNKNSEKRLETFLNYIEPFPIYAENDRYMKFILAFYDKEFREYLPVTEEAIMKAIYFKSPTLLMQTLKSDIFLANPALRELVMIDKLGKAFYREIGFRPNIITILDSVANHANSQVNASVAKNVKKYITNLEPGYPAPAVQFIAENNSTVTWSDYQGKFIYFNFFATWNDASIKDMGIIAKLVAEYDEDFAFVSVCVDKDSATYKAFLMEHPDYYWDIFYVGEDEDLMNAYKASSVPNYYLIDQDGFIFAAPALAPSPNGDLKYVEETLFRIKKALHPTKHIRVGEK